MPGTPQATVSYSTRCRLPVSARLPLRARRPNPEPHDGRTRFYGRATQSPRKLLGANGFKYKERFGVIVLCRDEAEHRAVYERLKAEGYKCKVVRV